MQKSIIYYLLTVLIFLSFLLGFYLMENSSGQAGDSIHIFHNYKLFEDYNITNLPWIKYGSSSLPLYYLITTFLFEFESLLGLKIFNFIIAIISFLIFYAILKNKFKTNNIFINSQIIFISSLVFLSPYFRTATFYGMEEITGIFFLLTTIYFFKIYKENKKNLNLFLCILCSCLCFYSRQSYLFLLVVIFFSLIDLKIFITKKNITISLLFVVLLIPSLDIFYIWGGIHTPAAVEVSSRNKYLQIQNLPFILNIMLIYLIPFAFLIFKNLREFNQFILSKFHLLSLFFTLNLMMLSIDEIPSVGGGAFSKLILITFESKYVYLVIYSLLASISLMLIYKTAKNSSFFWLLFISMSFVFLNIDLVFQEYFDPLIFVFLLAFYDFSKINKKKLINFPLFMGCYYLLFLASSLFYYYKIV